MAENEKFFDSDDELDDDRDCEIKLVDKKQKNKKTEYESDIEELEESEQDDENEENETEIEINETNFTQKSEEESDHGQENKDENNAEKNEPVKVMEIEGQQISAKESNNDIKKITISLPNDERRKGKKKLLGKKRRIKRKNFCYCVKKSRNKFKSNKKNNSGRTRGNTESSIIQLDENNTGQTEISIRLIEPIGTEKKEKPQNIVKGNSYNLSNLFIPDEEEPDYDLNNITSFDYNQEYILDS